MFFFAGEFIREQTFYLRMLVLTCELILKYLRHWVARWRSLEIVSGQVLILVYITNGEGQGGVTDTLFKRA
jgi:hypothetical protein